MADRLDGLRLYAVIGSDYQYSDIGDLCTPGTHGGKCFVSRRIQEYDLLSVDGYLRRTDVLGDTTGLIGGDVGVSNCVQQGSFTVVNVTHNGDDRSSGFEFAFRILMQLQALFRLLFNFFGYHNADAQIIGQHLHHIFIDSLVQSSHDSHLHQRHDDGGSRDLCLFCQSGYRNRCGYRNGTFRQKLFYIHFRFHILRHLLLAVLGLLLQRIFIEISGILAAAVSFIAAEFAVTISAIIIILILVVEELLALALSGSNRFRSGGLRSSRFSGTIGPASVLTLILEVLILATTPVVLAVSLLLAIGGAGTALFLLFRSLGRIEDLLETHRLVRCVYILFFLLLRLLLRSFWGFRLCRFLRSFRFLGNFRFFHLHRFLGCSVSLCSRFLFLCFDFRCLLYNFQCRLLWLFRLCFRYFFFLHLLRNCLLRCKCWLADWRRLDLWLLGTGFLLIITLQDVDSADDAVGFPIFYTAGFRNLDAQLFGISLQFLVSNVEFCKNVRYFLRHSLPPL